MSAATGHIVVWSCLCSDAADHPTWLAEKCPGHDAPSVCEPIANHEVGGVTVGHQCGERRCETTEDR